MLPQGKKGTKINKKSIGSDTKKLWIKQHQSCQCVQCKSILLDVYGFHFFVQVLGLFFPHSHSLTRKGV